MAYGTSAFVNSLTNSQFDSTSVTNAIALSDDLCEAYCQTTWSGTIPTAVITASSLIAAEILKSGLVVSLMKQNREPGMQIYRFITPEAKLLLEKERTDQAADSYSEDFT